MNDDNGKVSPSHQFHELVDGEAGFTDNFTQRAFGNFFVIRDRNAAKWFKILSKNHVAATLMIKLLANFG